MTGHAEPEIGDPIVIRHTKYRIVEIRDGPVYLLKQHPQKRARWSLYVAEATWDAVAGVWRVTDGILADLEKGGER
jgi:hypothetical protein